MKPSNLTQLGQIAELHIAAMDDMDYQLMRPLRQVANVLFARIMNLPPKGDRIPYRREYAEQFD